MNFGPPGGDPTGELPPVSIVYSVLLMRPVVLAKSAQKSRLAFFRMIAPPTSPPV